MLQRTKIIICISLSIITIFGCKNVVKDNKVNKSNKDYFSNEYKLWKKEFPDSLTEHFPKMFDKNLISYGSSYRNKPKEFLYLSVFKKLTKKEKQKFLEMQIAPDSCIIHIYSNKIYYGFDKKGLGECQTYIPVPDYNLINYEGQKPDDLQYYILELSHKTFINHDLYLRYYLPDEWRNGMSRGVGISEKENTIFYWLIMW